MEKFEIAVVSRPKCFKTGKVIAGKGTVVATRIVTAKSVSEAVSRVREEVEGTGFIVLQKAALNA